MGHVSHAIQLTFQGHCDLLFDLLRRVAGPLGDDLGVGISYIGVSLDGKVVERNHAPDKKYNRQAKDQNTIAQGEIDEVADHLPCPAMAVEKSRAVEMI